MAPRAMPRHGRQPLAAGLSINRSQPPATGTAASDMHSTRHSHSQDPHGLACLDTRQRALTSAFLRRGDSVRGWRVPHEAGARRRVS
jgi:hypothetical protein